MPFDTRGFMATSFQPRTADIKVEQLEDFFDEGEEPSFKIRGLTAHELAKANEAEAKAKNLKAMVGALESMTKEEQLKTFKDSIGLSDDTPADLAKRLELFCLGVVEPEGLQIDVAVRVATVAPIEFYQITTEILRLTGQGQEAEKKQKSSGSKTK